MWDFGLRKQQLWNKTGGIFGISYCWYGFVYCTVLMMAVLTDGRWKLAATYCNNIRYWQDVVESTCAAFTLQNARQEHSKHQSDSGQQVSSLPHMVPEVLASLFTPDWCPVLSRSRLCRPTSLNHLFPHCAAAEHWCGTICAKVSATEMK